MRLSAAAGVCTASSAACAATAAAAAFPLDVVMYHMLIYKYIFFFREF